MIITANSQLTNPLVTAAQARPPKAKPAAAENADASLTDQVMITSQNIASAVSPLADADAARTALQAVRKQFLTQPNVAMLAQANQLPQNALRLLQ